jgi:hypothetical protein
MSAGILHDLLFISFVVGGLFGQKCKILTYRSKKSEDVPEFVAHPYCCKKTVGRIKHVLA